jgi:hypothetical protein
VPVWGPFESPNISEKEFYRMKDYRQETTAYVYEVRLILSKKKSSKVSKVLLTIRSSSLMRSVFLLTILNNVPMVGISDLDSIVHFSASLPPELPILWLLHFVLNCKGMSSIKFLHIIDTQKNTNHKFNYQQVLIRLMLLNKKSGPRRPHLLRDHIKGLSMLKLSRRAKQRIIC